MRRLSKSFEAKDRRSMILNSETILYLLIVLHLRALARKISNTPLGFRSLIYHLMLLNPAMMKWIEIPVSMALPGMRK